MRAHAPVCVRSPVPLRPRASTCARARPGPCGGAPSPRQCFRPPLPPPPAPQPPLTAPLTLSAALCSLLPIPFLPLPPLSPPHPLRGSTRAWHSPPLAHTPPFSASLLLRPALSRLLARSLARSPHSGPPCSCLSSRPLSPLPLPALLPVLPRLGLLIAALAELSLVLCRCPRSSPSPSALPALRLCLLTPSGLAAPGSLLRSAPSPALPDRLRPPPVFSRAFPSTSDSLPSPLTLLLLPQTSFSPPPSPLSASLSGPPPSLSSRSPFLVPLLISCVSPCAFSSLLSSWLPSPAGFHPFSPHPFILSPSFPLSPL